MTSRSDKFRKLCRLRAKRARLDRRIKMLERKFADGKFVWGNCSRQRKR